MFDYLFNEYCEYKFEINIYQILTIKMILYFYFYKNKRYAARLLFK